MSVGVIYLLPVLRSGFIAPTDFCSGFYICFVVGCDFHLVSYVTNQLKILGGLINEGRISRDLYLD